MVFCSNVEEVKQDAKILHHTQGVITNSRNQIFTYISKLIIVQENGRFVAQT